MNLIEVQNNYKSKVTELQSFLNKYQIETINIESFIEQIDEFKVVTPVIGGFSSGKSSLINSMLDRQLLPTEITPETSIPTEVVYSSNEYAKKLVDKKWFNITLSDIEKNNYSYKETSLLNAFVNTPFLKEIANVKIVDIPGLDSGIEAHNNAIDNYLTFSLAYIITVDCEQGLTESIILFLKELNLLNMPILIVVTKSDKKTDSDVDAMVNDVRLKVERIAGVNRFEITSASARKKDVEYVKEFLRKIQNQATDIFTKSYKDKININIKTFEQYLNTRLNKNDFTLEEIGEQEKILVKQIDEIKEKLAKEKEKLNAEIEKCIQTTESKIRMNLETNAASFVNDLVNKRDLTSSINSIARNSVLESIQSEINPRIMRYFSNIADMVNFDNSKTFDFQEDQIKNQMNEMMKENVKKLIPFALASIGLAIGGPIGLAVGALLSVLADMFFANKKQNELREQAETKVRNEIIPNVTSQVIVSFRTSIHNYLIEINEKIEESINKDKEIKEKGLEDLKRQKALAAEKQENMISELKGDLEKVKQLYI